MILLNFYGLFPIAHKSQINSIFVHFHSYIVTQFDKHIICFQCDNGKELNNGSLHQFSASHGIHLHFSCSYTSPQNSKAERKIHTINNTLRNLFLATCSSNSYLSPQHPSLQTSWLSYSYRDSLPQNSFFSHLRIFGYLCYPLIPSTSRNKLQARSKPCLFLGFPTNHRRYKCLDLSTRKITISHLALFDEYTFPFSQFHSFFFNSISCGFPNHFLSQPKSTPQPNFSPDSETSLLPILEHWYSSNSVPSASTWAFPPQQQPRPRPLSQNFPSISTTQVSSSNFSPAQTSSPPFFFSQFLGYFQPTCRGPNNSFSWVTFLSSFSVLTNFHFTTRKSKIYNGFGRRKKPHR